MCNKNIYSYEINWSAWQLTFPAHLLLYVKVKKQHKFKYE